MPERRPLVAANWKMHKTTGEAQDFVQSFAAALDDLAAVDVVVCPPLTALATTAWKARGTPIRLAAQNMHQAGAGAFTGEVSAEMVRDAGAWGVVLGHSERRRLFGETDEALAEKVPAALDAGLVPILCVGESEAERDAGQTVHILSRQLDADLAEVGPARLAEVVIAYEPVWAIGTGRTATPAQAEKSIAEIRGRVAARARGAAAGVRILYGGSVKPDNAGELIREPDIDGFLVGGASLDPDDFAAICRAAVR